MNPDPRGAAWFRRFRTACFVGVMIALVWTILMVIPVAPFSEAPRVIVSAPGEWLLVAYLIYIILGVGAFGWFSGMLKVIEIDENRKISQALMWPGFSLFLAGVTLTCGLLGYAGAAGGYASINGTTPSLQQMLTPYINPITGTTLVTVMGAFLVLISMVRAKGP